MSPSSILAKKAFQSKETCVSRLFSHCRQSISLRHPHGSQRRKNDDRQSANLKHGSENVGGDEDCETKKPDRPLEVGSFGMSWETVILEMRLALDGEAGNGMGARRELRAGDIATPGITRDFGRRKPARQSQCQQRC